MKNATVIFDNGGGITLQLGEWGHWYQDPAQAACDYITYQQDGHADGWDGHEPDALDLDPDYDDIRNGGYRVYDETEIADALKEYQDGTLDTGWGNLQDFIAALAAIETALAGRKMEYYTITDSGKATICVDGREVAI